MNLSVCVCVFCFLIHCRLSTDLEDRETNPGFATECPWNVPSLAESRFSHLQNGNHNPHSTKNGVESTKHHGETADMRSMVAISNIAAVMPLNCRVGIPGAPLTHGPPVECAHEGEDAVVGAAGGLEARNSSYQSQLRGPGDPGVTPGTWKNAKVCQKNRTSLSGQSYKLDSDVYSQPTDVCLHSPPTLFLIKRCHINI